MLNRKKMLKFRTMATGLRRVHSYPSFPAGASIILFHNSWGEFRKLVVRVELTRNQKQQDQERATFLLWDVFSEPK